VTSYTIYNILMPDIKTTPLISLILLTHHDESNVPGCVVARVVITAKQHPLNNMKN